MQAALFQLGQVVTTRTIADELEPIMIETFIRRHVTGDFGNLHDEDIEMNKEAVKSGEDRILSAYDSPKGKVYVITEWNREYTTVLFADEY